MPNRPTRIRSRHRASRAMSLVELIVAVALMTGVALVNLRVLSSVRRVSKLDEAKTRLALAAHAQLARLRAVPWEDLPEGRKAFEKKDLESLGLDAAREISGEVAVRDVEGLELKEITVRLEWKTTMGTFSEEMALWRGKDEP